MCVAVRQLGGKLPEAEVSGLDPCNFTGLNGLSPGSAERKHDEQSADR
jgi:hypothetical protein